MALHLIDTDTHGKLVNHLLQLKTCATNEQTCCRHVKNAEDTNANRNAVGELMNSFVLGIMIKVPTKKARGRASVTMFQNSFERGLNIDRAALPTE